MGEKHITICVSKKNYSRLLEYGESKKSRSFDQTIDFLFDVVEKAEMEWSRRESIQ